MLRSLSDLIPIIPNSLLNCTKYNFFVVLAPGLEREELFVEDVFFVDYAGEFMSDLAPEDVWVVGCVEGGGVCFCDGDPFAETLGCIALVKSVLVFILNL